MHALLDSSVKGADGCYCVRKDPSQSQAKGASESHCVIGLMISNMSLFDGTLGILVSL